MPEGGVVSGAAGAEDPWSTAAVVLGEQTAGGAPEASGASAAVVHYYFPVQIEVLEPLPVDQDAITDQALQRLTQHLEGR
jgi:hypothetical protein